jgi:hypothetical protein
LQSLVNFPYSHRRSRFQGKRPLLTRWSSSHRISRRTKHAESLCRRRPRRADPENLNAPAWRRNSTPGYVVKIRDTEILAVSALSHFLFLCFSFFIVLLHHTTYAVRVSRRIFF